MTDISGSNGVSDGSTRHYTPTTEEVRNIFSWNHDGAEVDAKIGFDRWLGVVKAQAVAEWLAERMAKVTLEDYEQGETE